MVGLMWLMELVEEMYSLGEIDPKWGWTVYWAVFPGWAAGRWSSSHASLQAYWRTETGAENQSSASQAKKQIATEGSRRLVEDNKSWLLMSCI